MEHKDAVPLDEIIRDDLMQEPTRWQRLRRWLKKLIIDVVTIGVAVQVIVAQYLEQWDRATFNLLLFAILVRGRRPLRKKVR